MKTIRFKAYNRSAILLDARHLNKVRAVFSFSSPAARHSPEHAQWLRQKAEGVPIEERTGWDGKNYMMDKAGVISVGLLLGSEKELTKAGYKAEITKWKDKPSVTIQDGFMEDDKKYGYQNDCVNSMCASCKRGGGLVLSATGTGKTKIAAQFFSWVKGKCVFIVDQVDLLYQSQKEIQFWLTKNGIKEKVGIVGNGKFAPERITVAIVQSLQKQNDKFKKYVKWAKGLDVAMIDELHVQMARRSFTLINGLKPQAVIGLTATMQLGQKAVRFKCFSICGPKIFEFPIEEGTKAGVLTQGVVVQAFSSRNKRTRKEVTRKKKDKRTGKVKVGKDIATDYEHEVVYNRNLGNDIKALVTEATRKDKAIVVLVERVRHLKLMAKKLAKFSPRLCYGAVDVKQRKEHLANFDKGKTSLIIANRVFTKGINIKRVDLIIDAAQRRNKNDCMQKFGRGVRLHSSKNGLIYIGMFTGDKSGEKAATSQRSAFKKAKIPIEVMPLSRNTIIAKPFIAKDILAQAEYLLKRTLSKNV